jgi:hypothetical protein
MKGARFVSETGQQVYEMATKVKKSFDKLHKRVQSNETNLSSVVDFYKKCRQCNKNFDSQERVPYNVYCGTCGFAGIICLQCWMPSRAEELEEEAVRNAFLKLWTEERDSRLRHVDMVGNIAGGGLLEAGCPNRHNDKIRCNARAQGLFCAHALVIAAQSPDPSTLAVMKDKLKEWKATFTDAVSDISDVLSGMREKVFRAFAT